LLARARLAGRIPWEAIHDETHPCETWNIWADARAFVQAQVEGFLQEYWRDLLRSQPHHVELVCEKNTVYNIVASVAGTYCLPTTSGRGFSAIECYYEISQRHQASGKDRLILLLLTDLDPEGEEIVQVAGRTMQNDFGVTKLDVLKVALTTDEVRRYRLPANLEAKTSSANYDKFVAKYGTNAYELEALTPHVQQDLLRQAVESVLDMEAFQAEQVRQYQERDRLAQLRESCLGMLEGELRGFAS